ncbi:MAG: hypothetical protein WC659_01440 [Patescibacteria group bacterium]
MHTTLADNPETLEWMSPLEKKFRKTFPKIIGQLPLHSFLDKESFVVECFYTGQNVGSVVCKVRDKSGTYIVKSISDPQKLLIEVAFLQRWHEVGARVIKVLELIKPNSDFDACVAILEYIPTGTTEDILRESKKYQLSVYEKLGNGLALMHRAKGIDFGDVVDVDNFKGQHPTFREEIESMITPEKQELLTAEKLLTTNEKHLISIAITLVENDLRSGTQPSLIHDDPGVHNTFGIETITFFDPDPKISHPLIDLAIACVWAMIATGDQRSLTALARGYQSESPYNESALQACIFLKLLEKWQWWLYRGKSETFALEWIEKTKPLLWNAQTQLNSITR